MEWKKETVSKAEFERMQREYAERALAMQKSAGISSYAVMTGSELIAAAKAASLPDPPAVSEFREYCECTDIEENTRESDETFFVPDEENDESMDDACRDKDTPAVGEGLMEASQILEEMTRQTEIMKKFAERSDTADSDGECLPQNEADMSGTCENG